MISLIICSRDTAALAAVNTNVAKTIGVPFEIIAIDNSENTYGICEAYNTGAARAKFDLLCFMHEDLCFQTSDWGKTVIDVLSDPAIGILGVAGGVYQVHAPASWNSFGTEFIIMNVIQGDKKGGKKLMQLLPNDNALFEVAAVDGLWMCCRKSVWDKYKFDNKNFPEFHFYDIDFCTRVFPEYSIVVTPNILMEHFSQGSYNASWYENALKFYKIRKKYLPFGSMKLSVKKERETELNALQAFIAGYIDYDITPMQMVNLFFKCLAIDFFNKDSFWLIKKYIKVKILRSQV
jgi:hypothetical protein